MYAVQDSTSSASSAAGTTLDWRRFVASISDQSSRLTMPLLLVALVLSAFGPSLSFPPSDTDDMILMSSIANAPSPWQFFVGDSGVHNNVYRPLHSLVLWMTYQAVGSNNIFHQAINMIVHVAVTLLIFRVLRKVSGSERAAFLLAGVWSVSHQSASAAFWVSDRSAGFVAFFAILSFSELLRERPRASRLVLYSLLSLFSKESGLVVPVVVSAYSLYRNFRDRNTQILVFGLATMCGIYVMWRAYIFGPSVHYSEEGYLFGLRYYSATQARGLRFLVWPDNVIKNFVHAFVPVFTDFGQLNPRFVLTHFPLSLPVILLSGIALFQARRKRSLSNVQVLGLLIILGNAIVHFGVFRYRTLFLACMGFVFFVAPIFEESLQLTKNAIENRSKREFGFEEQRGIGILSLNILLLSSVLFTGRAILVLGETLHDEVRIHRLHHTMSRYPEWIAPKVEEDVLRRYGGGS